MKNLSHLSERYWKFYTSKRLFAIPMGITSDRFSTFRDDFVSVQRLFFMKAAKMNLAQVIFDGDTYVAGITGSTIKKMVKSLVKNPEDYGPEPPSSGQPALL